MKQNSTIKPKTFSDFPEYRAAIDKLENVRSAMESAKTEVRQSVERLQRGRAQSVDEAAERLLAGEGSIQTEASLELLNAELQRQENKLAVLKAAFEKQEVAIAHMRRNLSTQICASVQKEHAETTRAAVLATIEAMRNALAAWRIRDALGYADVSINQRLIPIILPPGFGIGVDGMPSALDRNSDVSFMLREAVDNGVIDQAEIPAEWREAWRH